MLAEKFWDGYGYKGGAFNCVKSEGGECSLILC